MNSIFSLKTSIRLLAITGAFFTATLARAQLSYAVSINTAPLIGNSARPFYLDLQSFFGSGAAQTITVSNFSLTGGTLLGTGTVDAGNVSGSLATSLTFTPSSANVFSEFYQGFSALVTNIKFSLNLTNAVAGVTPTSFAVSILDKDLFNITTSGIGDSLLAFNLNGAATNFQTAASTGAIAGVTLSLTAVPEASTYGTIAGAMLVSAAFWRRRRLHS